MALELKHTLLGIISFLLSVLTAAATFFFFALILLVKAVAHDAPPPGRFAQVVFVLCIAALLFANMVALGLGIAGMAQSERKKLFAVLGTVFASLQIAGMILLILAIAH